MENKKPSDYRLSIEDLEHLSLKVQSSMSNWLLGRGMFAVTLLFGLGSVSLYYVGSSLLDTAIDSKVAAYVDSEEFRQEVRQYFRIQFETIHEKIREVDLALEKIDDGLDRLAIYEAAPYQVSEHGFVLVGSDGQYVMVEYGSGTTGDEISFRSKFQQPPQVLLALIEGAVSVMTQRRGIVLGATSVSSSSFTPSAHTVGASFVGPLEVNWIAIGR